MSLSYYRLGVTYPRTMARQKYPVRKRRKRFLSRPSTGGGNVYNRSVSHTLTFNQVLVKGMHRIVNQTLSLSQTLAQAPSVKNRSVSNTLAFSQTVTWNPAVHNVSASNTWTAFQVAEATRIRKVSNTLTFSQTATGVKGGKGAYSTITFQQVVAVQIRVSLNLAQTFGMTDSVVLSTIRPRAVSHTLTISQSAVATRVKVRSVSHLLVFAHEAKTPRAGFARNTFLPAHSVSVSRVRLRSASNVLTLNQAVSKTGIFNFNITQTLTIVQGRIQQIGISEQTVHIPGATGNVVRNLVVLQSPHAAITLPAPKLNDGQSYSGSVLAKRSMDGETYTYVKKTDLNKLRYTFEIGRPKSLELRSFYLQFNSTVLTLTNWKGEVWRVHVVNNPFDLTMNSRYAVCDKERVEVTLEFEGVRIS